MKQRLTLLWGDPRVAILLLLALATRLLLLPSRTLWYDEAYSIVVSRQPLPDIWALTAVDVHPPLYYILLHGCMQLFGDSVWVIRGLSVAAGTGAIVLAACWLRLFASPRTVYIALSLLALQPIAVRYSQEARMYALLAFWLMAASLVMALWQRRPDHRRYPVLYALVVAAALYTHYFAFLGIASYWAYALLTRRSGHSLWRRRTWWIANLAALALFVPWFPELYRQLHATGGIGWIPPLTPATIPTTLWEFVWTGSAVLRHWPVLAALVPMLVAWSLWQNRRTNLPQPYADPMAMAMLAIMPIVLAGLVSLFKPLFVTRYLSFTALPMMLVIALAIDTLSRRRATLAWLLLVAIIGVQCAGLVNGYRNGQQIDGPEGDDNGSAPLAMLVQQQWRPGDEVVASGDVYLSVIYYLREHPLPWLWLESTDPLPLNNGADAVLYRLGRVAWLRRYIDLPPATCGIWVFTPSNEKRAPPPLADWTPGLHRVEEGTTLDYYSRQQCAVSQDSTPTGVTEKN